MKLGDKPISEMTYEEMLEATTQLRESREALRNEAIKQKKEREAKGVPEPKVKAERKPKEKPEDLLKSMGILDILEGKMP